MDATKEQLCMMGKNSLATTHVRCVGQKLSSTKRRTRLVLPTPESPHMTTFRSMSWPRAVVMGKGGEGSGERSRFSRHQLEIS